MTLVTKDSEVVLLSIRVPNTDNILRHESALPFTGKPVVSKVFNPIKAGAKVFNVDHSQYKQEEINTFRTGGYFSVCMANDADAIARVSAKMVDRYNHNLKTAKEDFKVLANVLQSLEHQKVGGDE